MIFYEIKNKKDGKIIISNMASFEHANYFKDNKNQKIKEGFLISRLKEDDVFSVWIISVGNEDLFKSSVKKFNFLAENYLEMSKNFFDFYVNKMNGHSHTITTIQGQMLTKLEGLIQRKQFRSSSYSESIEKLKGLIFGREDEISEILFYLDKRLFDMRNQIDGFNFLYINNDINIDNLEHNPVNIKKVILNIATPFLDDFKKNKIRLNIESITDDFAQNNKIILNYKFFNLAMYNFFDNISKYSKEVTDVKITLDYKNENHFSLYFEMVSRYIDSDEINLIFEDGYSGKHSAGKSGNGIGMFYTKKALNIVGLDIVVDNIYGDFFYENNRYSTNVFKVYKP